MVEDMVQISHQNIRSSRSIQEFQIDLLLEEEFLSNSEFARQFLAICSTSNRFRSVQRAVRSMSDKFGEADLVVLMSVERESGEINTLALLIEDKITAPAQPNQAARYKQRGDNGCNVGDWEDYVTVLVAPEKYIKTAHGYDAAVTLEQIEDLFCPTDQERRKYKVRAIREAMEKKNASGVQIVDPAMTAFRAAYYDALQQFNSSNHADFRMRLPAPTYWGDYWFKLKNSQLPHNAEIRHVPRYGSPPYTAFVELIFHETPSDKLNGLWELLDANMNLVQVGKYKQNTSIRVAAETITVFDDFERDKDKVVKSFQSALRLVYFYQQHRAQINAMLNS
jgi:hypothetical protein